MPASHQSLFNHRLIAKRLPQESTPIEHKQLLEKWAAQIQNGVIQKQKETEIRGPFIHRFFVSILGYHAFANGDEWTINDEKRTGSGSADTALGFFSGAGKKVIAPVELKGADTKDLDAIMPGRHKSPVDQVWEYANDTAGCTFMLVSNMVEFRLYAIGYTRQVYEKFKIVDLAASDTAYQHFRLLLSAENLLSGNTAKLLKESFAAESEITQKLYTDYKSWRINLLISLMRSTNKPAEFLIEPVQKILDRVLFIAFAEDRRLLPPKQLHNAYSHRDPYHSRPIWENFRGLFNAIDKGNVELNIPAYNGGLFAPDPLLDGLPVSDDACRMFDALGGYDFDSEVSVTVLGHIFEQSVSDLEKLKELSGCEDFSIKDFEEKVSDSASSVSGKRKSDGIVYTPDIITRFIVDQTLGTYLADRRTALRAAYVGHDGNWRKPTDEEKTALTGRKKQVKIKSLDRLVEFLFWTAWRDVLSQIRVVDPACGSGAFLIAAFDLLDAEYHRVNEQIQTITGNPDLFDINREILNGNLYGVDINPESIEITKLSLWLKTAKHGKPLESLEANLKIGNSLIEDGSYAERPFKWQVAFPQVFSTGGFDVVLGNPPYVRMEFLKTVKPYLEQRYIVSSDRADLYCYFFELGISLLKPGGRLGYISSSTYFKSGSGEPLRKYMLEKSRIRTLVDFGDIKVFQGVTTYPAIVVLDRIPANEAPIRFLVLGDVLPESLAAEFQQHAGEMPQSQLGADGWVLESLVMGQLRRKLSVGRKTLKDVYGSPCRGVVTGLNEAFIIDASTRKRLIAEDARSAELLKPFLKGADDVAKWRIEGGEQWLIYIPKGKIVIDDFPAIKGYLLAFKHQLEKRATQQAWFELQQPQDAYISDFNSPKLIYPEMSQGSKFAIDESGYFLLNKLFYIPTTDYFLLGLLNSKAVWAFLFGICSPLRGGEWRLELRSQYVETVPIPNASNEVSTLIASLAESALRAARERRDLLHAFCRRVQHDLIPGGTSVKLTTKLSNWAALTFKAFHDELKKQFKITIPLNERDAWQSRFDNDQDRVVELTNEIARCEKIIDVEVYRLFELTAEEITLLEASIK